MAKAGAKGEKPVGTVKGGTKKGGVKGGAKGGC